MQNIQLYIDSTKQFVWNFTQITKQLFSFHIKHARYYYEDFTDVFLTKPKPEIVN